MWATIGHIARSKLRQWKIKTFSAIARDRNSRADIANVICTRLPESQRDRWFDEVEAKGYTDETLPPEYLSARWRRKT
jgi:hypothetical protein